MPDKEQQAADSPASPSGEQDNGLAFDPDTNCDSCGKFGAYAFDGQYLCAECYELRGSCCPEFGADDLWRDPDESDSSK